MLGYGIITPAIPIFAKILNVSERALGFAFSAYPVAFILVVLPVGKIIDRTGKHRLVISSGMFLLFLSSCLLTITDSFIVFFAARAFQGMASAVSWVAAQPLASKCAESGNKRARYLSLISASYGLGLIAGPIIGGMSPFELPFLICAVISLLMSVVSFFAVKDDFVRDKSENASLFSLLAERKILSGCAVIFYAYLCVGVLELLFPLYMDSLGFQKAEIGILFCVMAIVLKICQPLIGKWISLSGCVKPVVASFLIAGVTITLFVESSSFILWTVLSLFFGFALGTMVTASMTLISQSPVNAEGTAYALWNMSFSVAYLIAPVGAGIISVSLGIKFPFFIASALSFIIAGFFYVSFRKS